MGRLSKSFALIFILIMAISSASLLTIKPANAQIPTVTQQGVPVPDVPSSVTLSLTGPPYVQPTTYQLDPSTGKIVAKVGYTNEYGYLVITIKNQPNNYAPYSVYYNVREGNASENSWWYPLTPNFDMSQSLPTQSTDSGYTNISFPIDTESYKYTLEVEVQAMVGSIVHQFYEGISAGWIFSGQTSDWSSPQTITIPASVPLSPTPAPSSSSPLTPTETPTSTAASGSLISFLLITNTISLIVIAFLLAVIIALLLYMRKRNRLMEST